jgi:hypothetical protein
VGGVVMGSVSIIKAKKSKGESMSKALAINTILCPFKKAFPMINSDAVAKKLITKSQRFIFRVIKNPTMHTKGAMYKVPTHQLAYWLKITAASITAKAAGLKRCFLFMARTYF